VSFDLKISKGDISLQRDGSLSLVSKNSKLRQDIVKIILTDLGENKFHKNYGSAVGRLNIGSYSSRDVVDMDIRVSVESALKKLMSLQKAQARKQFVSPGEMLVKILNVSAERDFSDPRLYNVYVSVLTGELNEIREGLTIRIA
tara:strand:+ start:213 stop:644 length:432 start_codon:yes stop_codon:yes gene_type:complete